MCFCLEHCTLSPSLLECQHRQQLSKRVLCALQAASCFSTEEHLALLGWHSQEWTALQKPSEVHSCSVLGSAIAASIDALAACTSCTL